MSAQNGLKRIGSVSHDCPYPVVFLLAKSNVKKPAVCGELLIHPVKVM